MDGAAQEQRTVGRYSLLSKIAAGGMGAVHLARLDSMQGVERFFAIKLLLPQFAEDKSVVDMFVTEARIASRITHPNVCQVFELGIERDELFICMEYLKGIPATSILKTHKPLNPVATSIAVAIVQQTCAGLQFAHDLKGDDGAPLGVVHRDISPGNIFLTTTGNIKVLDFGVVKAKDSSYKTRTGALKGKFGYMSPEQIMAEEIDHRSDIFSLGIVLFELLTNRRLFTRESEYATLKAITETPIPELISLRPDLPRELNDVLAKALARKVDDRYSSMKEFSLALGAAMKDNGGVADSAAIADYLETKFTYQLGQIEKMLQEVRDAPAFTPEPSQSGRGLADDDGPKTEILAGAPLATPEAPIIADRPKAGRGIGLVLAIALVGVGVVALALVLLLKKDDPVPEAARIVVEGQVRPEDGDSQRALTKRADAGVVVSPMDAGAVAAHSDATTSPVKQDKHRCESKEGVAARNRCYVAQSGRKLSKCLSEHAVEISGSPEISLSFDLNKRGQVLAVEISPAALATTALGTCVMGIANAIRFGPQEDDIRFRIPLTINSVNR